MIFIHNSKIVITWLLERKLCNNHYLRLPSLTSILTSHLVWFFSKPQVFFKLMHSIFLYPTHLTSYYLYYNVSKASMYKLEKHSTIISIYKLSTCWVMKFIIFEHHLVMKSEQLIRHNQTSFFVKLSAFSSILIKVLARW